MISSGCHAIAANVHLLKAQVIAPTLSLAFTILKSRLQAKKLVATTVCAHTVVDALAHSAIALT